MSKGFTLIELLIVISIVGIMLTVAIPASYSVYKNYKDSLEAERILMLISSMRRESFLFSKETVMDTKVGRLILDDAVHDEFKDIFFHTSRPVVFYKNGTTSGGQVSLRMKDNSFSINIDAPSGELRLIKQATDRHYEPAPPNTK